MINKLLAHDRAALGQAITLIESTLPAHQRQVDELFAKLPPSTHPFIIGLSGTPGVGKSTLIDVVGEKMLQQGPLAILTIDPSSHITGGSILGDKARMEKLAQCEHVYIRPSPSKGVLGGLGPKTAITLDLLSRLNFKTIMVESVGVGQSEIDLAALSDLFIVILAPGGGDDLQGLKRGILEVADLVLINKADIDPILAQETKLQYESSLHFLNREWPLKVLLCSAVKEMHMNELMQLIAEAKKCGRVNPVQKKILLQDFMLNSALDEIKQEIMQDSEFQAQVKKFKGGYGDFRQLIDLVKARLHPESSSLDSAAPGYEVR